MRVGRCYPGLPTFQWQYNHFLVSQLLYIGSHYSRIDVNY